MKVQNCLSSLYKIVELTKTQKPNQNLKKLIIFEIKYIKQIILEFREICEKEEEEINKDSEQVQEEKLRFFVNSLIKSSFFHTLISGYKSTNHFAFSKLLIYFELFFEDHSYQNDQCIVLFFIIFLNIYTKYF